MVRVVDMLLHYQQYFSIYRGDQLYFLMATGVSGENHRSDASH